VLNFDDEDQEILKKHKLNGRSLLLVPSSKILSACGLVGGPTTKLWDAIIKMKNHQVTRSKCYWI